MSYLMSSAPVMRNSSDGSRYKASFCLSGNNRRNSFTGNIPRIIYFNNIDGTKISQAGYLTESADSDSHLGLTVANRGEPMAFRRCALYLLGTFTFTWSLRSRTYGIPERQLKNSERTMASTVMWGENFERKMVRRGSFLSPTGLDSLHWQPWISLNSKVKEALTG